MKKLLIIARSNMRKAKGQTAAIIVLVFLAAMLLNLWLMLSLDYHANFDRFHDKFNAEHVIVSVDGDTDEVRNFLEQTLDGNDNVQEYRLDSCLNMTSTFSYNGGQMNSWFIFFPKDVALTRSIGKAEIVEECDVKSGIYMPILYKSEDVQLGKPFKLTIGSHTVEYVVCGFFNNLMMGSHNCALTEIIMTDDKYEELENSDYALKATLCSVRLKDIEKNVMMESELKSVVSEHFPNIQMTSNCYDIVSQARYTAQDICTVIVMAMAFLVLLIAIVVIVSNIVNYIQVNMRNLGVLKAVGYTSRQLICSLLLQFSALTLVAALIGVALSYCLFPAINNLMIMQTGIPYAIRFLPLPLLISVVILGGSVVLAVWLAARRIKKIEPIVALRSGVATHNFKKNHLPLDKTNAPINVALAMKTTLSGVKHNITVCITMMVLSLVVVFSGLMFENAIVDFTPFLNLVVGETADCGVSVQSDFEKEFLEKMNADERVEKVYLYHTLSVEHSGGVGLLATLSDDFAEFNNQDVIIEGRFPKYANEIAVGAKYAQEKDIQVGDEIGLTANGKVEKYLVCGFTHISNFLGRDCLLTRQGYERLGELTNNTYYISLASGVDIDAFTEEMQQKFQDRVFATLNLRTVFESVGDVYVNLMTIIVIAILVLSAIIITFVLYLLVRTMLNNKMRDYGVLKSLGFTTRQLILQTALSFMPAIILSTVLGLIISCFAINPLMSLFLSSIGIVKCTFAIPVAFSAVSGVALILLSFGIACLLSLKIKKIAPKNLLVGE